MTLFPGDDAAEMSVASATPNNATPGWMITFADLLSLLLSFFVLLYATTAIDPRDWERQIQPAAAYFGARQPLTQITENSSPSAVPTGALSLNYLTAALTQLTATDPALKGAQSDLDDHVLTFTLPAALVACRSYTPAPVLLDGLATLLQGTDNRIEIAAHGGLDPTVAATPADWRGILDRAAAFSRTLRDQGFTRTPDLSARADLPGGRNACGIDIRFFDTTSAAGGSGAAP